MINSTSTRERERRDWTLLVFIIPIGILLMFIAGQIAVRLVPKWSMNAGMQSNLDLNSLPNQQYVAVQPILPAILTPLGWFDTFLTPGAGGSGGQIVFPPFIVFEPSANPQATLPPPTQVIQPSPTIPSATLPTNFVSPTVPAGTVKPPTGGETLTPTPTKTNTPTSTKTNTPTSTKTNTPTPTKTNTPTPTNTTVIPAPTNTPTTIPPTPTTVPTPTPVPTPTGTPSIPPTGYGAITPVPTEIDVNATPDGTAYDLSLGKYVVLDLGGKILKVSNTPDGNYDLIFYELVVEGSSPSWVDMDNIIIGISNNTDGSYYEVFYWGNTDADVNTNVNYTKLPPDPDTILCTVPECDNRQIPTEYLYGSLPNRSGILIDVDNAPGAPPPDDYRYIVIVSPLLGAVDGSAQVDSIQVTEVPIPPDPPAPVVAPASSVEEPLPTEEVPIVPTP